MLPFAPTWLIDVKVWEVVVEVAVEVAVVAKVVEVVEVAEAVMHRRLIALSSAMRRTTA